MRIIIKLFDEIIKLFDEIINLCEEPCTYKHNQCSVNLVKFITIKSLLFIFNISLSVNKYQLQFSVIISILYNINLLDFSQLEHYFITSHSCYVILYGGVK